MPGRHESDLNLSLRSTGIRATARTMEMMNGVKVALSGAERNLQDGVLLTSIPQMFSQGASEVSES